jgi:mono/diheme cytochrome c family protein
MNKSIIILSMALLSGVAQADTSDPVMAQGKALHEDKCTSCHGTEVYTREDRRVTSLGALSHQVNNCMKGPANANWSVAETNAVVEYLNTKFYKF